MVDWIHISTLSGSGDTTITVTADTNAQLTQRLTSLLVSGQTKSKTVSIIQTDIILSGNAVTFDATGGTSAITYTASTAPTLSLDNNYFTAVVSGNSIVITADISPTASTRTATLTATVGNAHEDVTITQSGVTFTVSGSSTQNIMAASTSSTFTITGNVNWKPSVVSGNTWLTLIDTSTRYAGSAANVGYNADTNMTVGDRHGVIAATWGDSYQYSTEVAYVVQEGLPIGTTDYLTFDILSAGTIVWQSSESMSYRKNGTTWTPVTAYGTTINVSQGDKLEFKAVNTWCHNAGFSGGTATFGASGNVMSMLYGDNFIGNTQLPPAPYSEDSGIEIGTFSNLFYDTNMVSAEHLVLPASTLNYACYAGMFINNHQLVTPPVLPATTLAPSCYEAMFMGCDSLTSAPELNVRTMAKNSYASMFKDCTSLTTAPGLPASTLADGCYLYMFYGCTGLTSAPDLLAPEIVGNCYDYMFGRCTQLSSVKCLATTQTPGWCNVLRAASWLQEVSPTGTFTKASGAEWIPWDGWTECGNGGMYSGIPDGWTVVTV